MNTLDSSPMASENHESILAKLEKWVAEQPDKPAWTFLDDKGKPNDSYSYQELDHVSSSLAMWIAYNSGLKKGDRALLVFFPGLHFMVSLLACFKAGIIAVPVFPPDPRKLVKDLHHFVSIRNSSGATVAFTHAPYAFAKKVAGIKNVFGAKGLSWPDIKWMEVDKIITSAKSKSTGKKLQVPPTPSGKDIAFLQYTSGSTSEPKGVMISHDNLAHNETIITRELKADTSTICVSWLPQYHDMGLIGSYLGAIYCGGSGYYLSPISFLKDPTVWLTSMSKYQATHTQAPNFAYALATRKYKEKKNPPALQLSTMKHMINAAEPVDSIAIEEFYSTFGPSGGLPAGVVVPTYGLAEHTVFVCSGGKQQLVVSKSGIEERNVEIISEDAAGYMKWYGGGEEYLISQGYQCIVGCGYPKELDQVELYIVDGENNNCILGDDKIGEIWVDSPSKAQGYFGNEDVTREEFKAVPSSSSQGTTVKSTTGFLRTGDLGFLHKGEVFICGRSKDLIIVRGSNHYPQDIERTVEKADPRIRPGCSAAFSMAASTSSNSSHTESVVYIAEIKDGNDTSETSLGMMVDAIRKLVASDHGFALSNVCILRQKTIPKTTSGKIARSWCRKAFMEDKLDILYRWDSPVLTMTAAGVGGDDDGYLLEGGDDELRQIALNSSEAAVALRELDVVEITTRLENLLTQISSQSPSPLEPPIDKSTPLMALGLDSMTVIQIRGVIEKKFYCILSDEFIFSQLATIDGIVEAVKNGGLTDAQKEALEAAEREMAMEEKYPVNKKQPLCPWWTCCY